ncbi:MAG: YjbQ family protein [Thermomicrobiales bacterium]|nr:YjbQ family protein [Thermomicrobiales bacterium]
MRSVLERVGVQTTADTQAIDVTGRVREIVTASGVQNGRVFVNTLHTTTAITVNEGLEDLEDDLLEFLRDLVPAERPYRHARFLHSDGQMAVNAPSHLRGALLGMHVSFPVADGAIVAGSRQTIYFVELDGPLFREYTVQVLGE